METKIPVKKLFRVARHTSTAIGLLTIAPVYIMTFSIAEILAPETMASIVKLSPFPPVLILLIGTVFITLLIFMFWSINIWLTYTLERYSVAVSAKTKYFISYLLCILSFFLLRLVLQILGTSIYHEIMNQKMSYLKLFQVHSIEAIRFVMIALFATSANTIILIIQDLLLLREKKTVIESENAQLKIKNIEATYNQLKQQIHPHFLFNSLNTLKTLIRKQPKEAESYLKKLSDFLRASVTFNNENLVKLGDELKFCLDYLDLQIGRFGEALKYTVEIPEEAKSGYVPVFSVQHLLENAIKHNALTSEDPLLVEVKYNNSRIVVTNNLQPKSPTEETTGRGLANLAERYKILSGDEIVFQQDDKHFSVSLKILDHEDSNH
ncbi:MAG TPA: histidine kinase [Bacteroidales bacterium]|nr:histidine kinase [Bacteroidales bacterium]